MALFFHNHLGPHLFMEFPGIDVEYMRSIFKEFFVTLFLTFLYCLIVYINTNRKAILKGELPCELSLSLSKDLFKGLAPHHQSPSLD